MTREQLSELLLKAAAQNTLRAQGAVNNTELEEHDRSLAAKNWAGAALHQIQAAITLTNDRRYRS